MRLAGLILDDSGLSGWAGKALAGWGAGEVKQGRTESHERGDTGGGPLGIRSGLWRSGCWKAAQGSSGDADGAWGQVLVIAA